MTIAELKQEEVSTKTPVFRSILMATDLSDASLPALWFAAELAAHYDAKLSLLHVLQREGRNEVPANPAETDGERADPQRLLDTLISTVRPGRAADGIVVRSVSIAPAVLSVIADRGTDLLVIGTHGRGGITQVALGSVAEELLRTAPCPVTTIGPKAAAGARKPLDFRSILFSTDFGAGSTKALPLVLQMVRAHQAKLILVHIIPPLPVASSIVSAYAPSTPAADEVQEWEASAAKRTVQNLRDWIAPYGHLQPEPEYIVGADFLAEGIFAAAGEFKAGLIVMGTKRSPSARVSAHLPWTAVHQVLHDAPCPVLSVAG